MQSRRLTTFRGHWCGIALRSLRLDAMPLDAMEERHEGRRFDANPVDGTRDVFALAPPHRCPRRSAVDASRDPGGGACRIGQDHRVAPVRRASRTRGVVLGRGARDRPRRMSRADRPCRRRSDRGAAGRIVSRGAGRWSGRMAGRPSGPDHRRSACHRVDARRIRAGPADRPPAQRARRSPPARAVIPSSTSAACASTASCSRSLPTICGFARGRPTGCSASTTT